MAANQLQNQFDVLIIGGGITGLAAAHYLGDTSFALLEASPHVGGKIHSERVQADGHAFLLEHGPDSFLTSKPWALALLKELGLESEIIHTAPSRTVYVYKNKRLIPMPEGLSLIIPTRIMPFLTSSLISWSGKLRAGLDLFLPKRSATDDETVANFVRRRMGPEILEIVAEPLLSGIYNASPETQSLTATFPQFAALEQKHRSLILGVLKNKRASKGLTSAPLFVSLRDGMGDLVTCLASRLAGKTRTNAAVCAIAKENDSFVVDLTNGQRLYAKKLIITTPAKQSAQFLARGFPDLAKGISQLSVQSSGICYLAYREEEIPKVTGYGVLFPRTAKRPINAVTFVSNKLEGRAPKGFTLLRVFFGGARNPDAMQMDDATLLRVIDDELKDILGIHAKPVFSKIIRWQDANPQYNLDHLERVQALNASLPEGLFLAGSSYRGVGIPDCVYQGKAVAELINKDNSHANIATLH